ncbi:diacylglycerol kinase family protein [Solibacillus sp. FSL H8-0538]|uniref:diacylglycerol kinase family protein n=1 Tax=Solibacillus sp. FSL H8-0538 TaxID=2921400 RepID=UPI0030F8874E
MNVRKFFHSFGYAAQGIMTATKEQNMRFHLLCGAFVLIAGLWTGLSTTEWLILVLVTALVVATELINTAIERVVDLASPELHPLAKDAKDVAAGAVLVIACASVIIGVLIFIPKWF